LIPKDYEKYHKILNCIFNSKLQRKVGKSFTLLDMKVKSWMQSGDMFLS